MSMDGVARPLSGPGVVARNGDLLLVGADNDAVGELLDAVADVARTGGDGETLARRVAALLATDVTGRFAACALAGPAANGRWAVLVHGSATADVDAGSGPVALSGVDAIASVNQLVPGPIGRIRLALPGAGQPDQRTSLESGVVTGAGIWFEPSPAATAPVAAAPFAAAPAPPAARLSPASPWPSPAPLPPVAPPPLEPPPVEPLPPVTQAPPLEPPAPAAVEWPAAFDAPAAEAPAADAPVADYPVVDAPVEDEPGLPRRPAPAPDDDAAPPEPIDRSHVIGVLCPKGHFIDPRNPYCPVCGVPLAQQTVVAREGVRPVLGSLVLDDGEVAPLEIGYVIGRDPKHDPEVLAGAARPLKITDTEGVVSRRHARIALVGWDVQIVDLGSSNGTFIQPPGASERQQLTPDTPVVIGPGTLITMGRRWLRYDPPRPD